MKKFFVSLIALILGTTGYVVVDETIETRVETLESQVSELNEEVSVLEDEIDSIKNPTKKHELIGTKIEVPMDSYYFKRYGYMNPKSSYSEKRALNELFINSISATIIDVHEPDSIEHQKYPYRIRLECEFKSIVNGPYVEETGSLGEDSFTLRISNSTGDGWIVFSSNSSGVFACECDIVSPEIESVYIGGFYSKEYGDGYTN